MTISAKIVADSISPANVRLTTMQLRYPKWIHNELMTHRVFSRNASSSRAIPVERLIKDVIEDPVYPMFWGKNQPGMSAAEECEALVEVFGWGGGTERDRNQAWDLARINAVKAAQAFAAAGYHKQIVNRLLEPFCHINVVVTSTEWTNFFALRCHKDAQPEMRELADNMNDALSASQPVELKIGEWHLPYVNEVERTGDLSKDQMVDKDHAIKVSVARCARVSYLTQEGKTPTIEEDLKLYDRLVGAVPLHASPAEHQATPDQRIVTEMKIHEMSVTPRGLEPGYEGKSKWECPEQHGNLCGWKQFRKMLPGECQ